MFFDCQLLRTFLTDIENWLQTNVKQSFRINRFQYVFGCLTTNSFITNFVQLHSKLFIHRSWQRKRELHSITLFIELPQFLRYLRYVINVEKQMAIDNNSLEVFETKFNEIIRVL